MSEDAICLYPWQHDHWQRLRTLYARWPHALLFYGQAGIGKVHFAQTVAQALLCESPTKREQSFERPCGQCTACHWFAQRNHPDYRLVCAESRLTDLNLNLNLNISVGLPSQDNIVSASSTSKGARALSQEIKIEQVRALLDFWGMSSHRAGWRVALLYPAEALNQIAANALLKILEEPPAGMVFLLVCSDIDQLLPTIVSRCQRWPMHAPTTTDARTWLVSHGLSEDAAATAIAYVGGAPLAALDFVKHKQGAGYAAWHRLAFDQLAAGAQCDALACAEALQKAPKPLVLGWMQRWLYDLAVLRATGQPRYYPAAIAALMRCVKRLDLVRLIEYARTVNQQRAIENHPINARLFFEALFLGYRSIFRKSAGSGDATHMTHKKKQRLFIT